MSRQFVLPASELQLLHSFFHLFIQQAFIKHYQSDSDSLQPKIERGEIKEWIKNMKRD